LSLQESRYEIVVIGGGIVGLATAMALTEEVGPSLAVLEAEGHLARHQTGNNSGVIHSGLYYKPDSLKARNCVEGRKALERFCQSYGVAYEQCGKIVVATEDKQVPRLKDLLARGQANGLKGLKWLDEDGIRRYEPHVKGVAGLHVPETGIVDFVRVAEAYADVVRQGGGEIHTNTRVLGIRYDQGALKLKTTGGVVRCRYLVNCAGLHSDRVARMCGLKPALKIIPFRGEYYTLNPDSQALVKNLVYPVPDPRFPFLGAHFTRMIQGGVEAGPNAVLAFKREGYHRFSISLRDMVETVLFPGFWRMVSRYWRTGLGEFYRSFNRAAFVRSLRVLIPELGGTDVRPGGAGVRAQAVDVGGFLVDDFWIEEGDRMIHVLNAPSPAATASYSIGRTLSERALRAFRLLG
jgi:L-2-hydroxyglutarate oxidase